MLLLGGDSTPQIIVVVLDVLVETAHVRHERRGRPGAAAELVDSAKRRLAIDAPNLVVMGLDLPDDRVVGADPRLVLVDVLVRHLEEETGWLPRGGLVHGTLIVAASGPERGRHEQDEERDDGEQTGPTGFSSMSEMGIGAGSCFSVHRV